MHVPPVVEPGPPLSRDEVLRYSRHLLLPGLGELGQRRLRNARVCVVGAGGLGAPVLLYLAAAGVGRLGIVDHDDVELSNLQRQVVHGWADEGRPKVESARDAVHALDSGTEVVTHHLRLGPDSVDEVLGGYDLVIDGTDNFPTRYLVNDACVRLGLPEVWGSIFRFDAQVAVFWGRPPAGVAPVQLRDLFPSPPPPGSVPSCAEGGVLGALCGQVGSLMATEAVKLLTGVGEPLLGRILVLDALAARWTEVPLVGGEHGPAALDGADGRPTGHDARREGGWDVPVAAGCAVPAGSPDDAAAVEADDGVPALTATELAARLAARDRSEDTFVLVDVREPAERAIVTVPGAVSVPLGRVLDGSALADLPRDVPLVLHCRSGVRSEQAARSLRAAGYDASHLAGGVLAWVADVDPLLPTY